MSDKQFMLSVQWIDRGREPKVAPNPAYHDGIDLDLTDGAEEWCQTVLRYPAKRCGIYVIECAVCGLRVGVTTAGRPDDPRSVKLACKRGGTRH